MPGESYNLEQCRRSQCQCIFLIIKANRTTTNHPSKLCNPLDNHIQDCSDVIEIHINIVWSRLDKFLLKVGVFVVESDISTAGFYCKFAFVFGTCNRNDFFAAKNFFRDLNDS